MGSAHSYTGIGAGIHSGIDVSFIVRKRTIGFVIPVVSIVGTNRILGGTREDPNGTEDEW